MLLYVSTSYRVLSIVYLYQLKGAHHTHIFLRAWSGCIGGWCAMQACASCMCQRSAFPAFLSRQDKTGLEGNSRIAETMTRLGLVARENLGKIWDGTGLISTTREILEWSRNKIDNMHVNISVYYYIGPHTNIITLHKTEICNINKQDLCQPKHALKLYYIDPPMTGRPLKTMLRTRKN